MDRILKNKFPWAMLLVPVCKERKSLSHWDEEDFLGLCRESEGISLD